MGSDGTPRGRTRRAVRGGAIDRGGARQPERFDPARAHVLQNPERERWLPYARIRELLDVPASGTVVDYGAGTGALAIPLALDFPDTTVVALDEQPAMLDRLKAAAGSSPPPNLQAVTAVDAAASAGTADRVLAVNVLHEAGDAALAELRGLLAPGGFALVIDWRADAARAVGPPASHAYTAEEAAARLEEAGFDVELSEEPQFPYHFVLVARHGASGTAAASGPSATRRRHREATLAALRTLAGARVTVRTASGTFEGYLDAAGPSDTSVTVLLLATPGGPPSEAVVIDLESIESISEA